MFSKQLVLFTVCFLYIGNVSTFSFEFQLSSIEWISEPKLSSSGLAPLVYPENVGHWYGTEGGIFSCIKFNGAIRIMVPVLLADGSSQTFPLDVPPEAMADGRCLNSIFSLFTNTETVNSISFRWRSPILGSDEMVTNELSIDFRYSSDGFGNPLYSISKFYVSFYKAQFVPGVHIKKIEQETDNLELFPVDMSNSFQCGQGELTARTDLFHVRFFDSQWQAFSDFSTNQDFKTPLTTSDCISVPIPSDEDDDTEVTAFWKVWIFSTVIVFVISMIIIGLLLLVIVRCIRCWRGCRDQNDEGYETFA